MSDTQEGVQNQDSSPQSHAQQTIPMERFHQEIAERKRLENEIAVYQALVRQQTPQTRPQAPRELPAHLKQLKEENPAMFQEFVRQDNELKKTRATNFQIMDQQDETRFLMEFGDKGGREMLPLVNQKLSECRNNGNHYFNRGQIFLMLKGYDSTTKPAATNNGQTSAPAKTQASSPQSAPMQNFPGQDPSAAQALTRSSAVTKEPGTSSIEDLEKKLENFEF